jgi:hypothetical protein
MGRVGRVRRKARRREVDVRHNSGCDCQGRWRKGRWRRRLWRTRWVWRRERRRRRLGRRWRARRRRGRLARWPRWRMRRRLGRRHRVGHGHVEEYRLMVALPARGQRHARRGRRRGQRGWWRAWRWCGDRIVREHAAAYHNGQQEEAARVAAHLLVEHGHAERLGVDRAVPGVYGGGPGHVPPEPFARSRLVVHKQRSFGARGM